MNTSILSIFTFVKSPISLESWSSILMVVAGSIFLLALIYGIKLIIEISNYDLDLKMDDELSNEMHEQLYK